MDSEAMILLKQAHQLDLLNSQCFSTWSDKEVDIWALAQLRSCHGLAAIFGFDPQDGLSNVAAIKCDSDTGRDILEQFHLIICHIIIKAPAESQS